MDKIDKSQTPSPNSLPQKSSRKPIERDILGINIEEKSNLDKINIRKQSSKHLEEKTDEIEEEEDAEAKLEYKIIFNNGTLEKIIEYKDNLAEGKLLPGDCLQKLLKKTIKNTVNIQEIVKPLSLSEFIFLLIQSKQTIEIFTNFNLFNDFELSILAGFNFAVPVNFFTTKKILSGQLLFTSALSFDGYIPTPETKEMMLINPGKNSVSIIGKKYIEYYKSNLLALLMHANQDVMTSSTQKKAFISISARDLESFSGYFFPIISKFLLKAIEDLLLTYSVRLQEIAGIYYDPYSDQEKQDSKLEYEKTISTIRLIVRSSKNKDDSLQSQVVPQTILDFREFADCTVYSIVFNRVATSPAASVLDPTKADAYGKITQSDALSILTGVKGEYKKDFYTPLTSSWHKIIAENELRIGKLYVVMPTGLFRDFATQQIYIDKRKENKLAFPFWKNNEIQKSGVVKVNYRTDLNEKDISLAYSKEVLLFTEKWVVEEINKMKTIFLGAIVNFYVNKRQNERKLESTVTLDRSNLTPGMIWTLLKNRDGSNETELGIDWSNILNISPPNIFLYFDCIGKFLTVIGKEKWKKNNTGVIIIAETTLSCHKFNTVGSLLFVIKPFSIEETKIDMGIRLLIDRIYREYCGRPKPKYESCKGDSNFICMLGETNKRMIDCYFDKTGYQEYVAKRLMKLFLSAYTYSQTNKITEKMWIKIPASALEIQLYQNTTLRDYVKDCLIRALAKFFVYLQDFLNNNNEPLKWTQGCLFDFSDFVNFSRMQKEEKEEDKENYLSLVITKIKTIDIITKALGIYCKFEDPSEEEGSSYQQFLVVPTDPHSSFGSGCHLPFHHPFPEHKMEAKLVGALKGGGKSLTTMNAFLRDPLSTCVYTPVAEDKKATVAIEVEKNLETESSLTWLKDNLMMRCFYFSKKVKQTTTTFVNPYIDLINQISNARCISELKTICSAQKVLDDSLYIFMSHLELWTQRFPTSELSLPTKEIKAMIKQFEKNKDINTREATNLTLGLIIRSTLF